jgi:hypothetical protein
MQAVAVAALKTAVRQELGGLAAAALVSPQQETARTGQPTQAAVAVGQAVTR